MKEVPKVSATDEQINEFIIFIDTAFRKGAAGLTDENKLELRDAFRTLVRTAKSEALAEVAIKLRSLHEELSKY